MTAETTTQAPQFDLDNLHTQATDALAAQEAELTKWVGSVREIATIGAQGMTVAEIKALIEAKFDIATYEKAPKSKSEWVKLYANKATETCQARKELVQLHSDAYRDRQVAKILNGMLSVLAMTPAEHLAKATEGKHFTSFVRAAQQVVVDRIVAERWALTVYQAVTEYDRDFRDVLQSMLTRAAQQVVSNAMSEGGLSTPEEREAAKVFLKALKGNISSFQVDLLEML